MVSSVHDGVGFAEPEREGLSRSGVWLLLLCFILAASAFPELRVDVAGLKVHPINFACAFVLLLNFRRIREVPPNVLWLLVAFVGAFALVSLIKPRGLSGTVKVVASAVTLLAAAVAVRNRSDFRSAAIALMVSAIVISVRGLLGGRALLGCRYQPDGGDREQELVLALRPASASARRIRAPP